MTQAHKDHTAPRISIFPAVTKRDIAQVKAIFLEYIRFIEAYLGQSIGFQNTDAEFTHFPQSYDILFLAHINAYPVAACGIKPFKDNICELKRLYCRPEGRGHQLGLRLTQQAIDHARDLGYKHIYLDTDAGLHHANKIYEQAGFTDIEQYYDTPLQSRFMAKAL